MPRAGNPGQMVPPERGAPASTGANPAGWRRMRRRKEIVSTPCPCHLCRGIWALLVLQMEVGVRTTAQGWVQWHPRLLEVTCERTIQAFWEVTPHCNYSCCAAGPLCGVLWGWSCHQPVGHCQPGLLLTAHVMPLSSQQFPSPSLDLVRAQDAESVSPGTLSDTARER